LPLGLDSAAFTARAHGGGGAGLRARAVAGGAGGLHRHLQRDLRARDRLVEADRHLRLQIAAAFGAWTLALPATAAPEQVGEDVAHRGGVEVEVAEAAEAAAGAGAGRERAAAAVVLLALLGIAEHVVRLGDLLEAGLRLLIVRIAVRVVLARELAVGLLDFLGSGLLVNPERLVVVGTARHLTPSPTRQRPRGPDG